MKKVIYLFLLLALTQSNLLATLKFGDGDYNLEIGGFVRNDVFMDTRESFEMREGIRSAFPLPKQMTADNIDLNSRLKFGMLPILTRTSFKFTGPEVLGAKVGAFVEVDWFGSSNSDMNSLRLRHAYVDLNFGSSNIKAGQFWHALYDTDVTALTLTPMTSITFNSGARNPQLRYTFNASKEISFFAAAMYQRDFSSIGPDGASNKYLRNSGIPELGAGFKYNDKTIGFSINAAYKVIQPNAGLVNKQNESIESKKLGTYGLSALFRLNAGDFKFRAMGMYGQNYSDFLNTTGYAIRTQDDRYMDYTPFNQIVSWADVSYGKDIVFGVYAGYMKNLGSSDNSTQTYYSKSIRKDLRDLSSLLKISPRIMHNIGKFRWGIELEANTGIWGKMDNKNKNKFFDLETVTNYRAVLSFIYFI